jgi:hypothetical protein
VNSVPTVEVQRVLDDRSRAIRGELAALRIGIARADIGRLDDVIADRRIIVADRLALGGKAREHRRRRRRAAQRQIESDQHPCPPQFANVVGPVYPRYFPLPTNAAREPNKFRARRQGERCRSP